MKAKNRKSGRIREYTFYGIVISAVISLGIIGYIALDSIAKQKEWGIYNPSHKQHIERSSGIEQKCREGDLKKQARCRMGIPDERD